MNAEQLLAQYERVAEAPDAVAQLRSFVLDLAVRGKLVRQQPSDEPATSTLRRISIEVPSPKIAPWKNENEAFPAPAGWVWIRFGALIVESDAGWSPKTENFSRSGNKWGVLKVSAVSWGRFLPDENKEVLPGTEPRDQAVVRLGDFLLSRANTAELVARAVVVETSPVTLMLSDKIVRLKLTKHCDKKFLLLVNNHADFARAHYAAHASGVSPSMKNVSRDVIYNLALPFPPLAEQHRIVAKVDELMAMCDRLEAARAQREATRDRLTAATLARLNTPEPAASPDDDVLAPSFQADARFTLNVLPVITNRPNQIKQLRRTIFSLAFRGALLPQVLSDGIAADLLNEIAKRKPPSAAGRKRQAKTVTSAPVGADEAPYRLPFSWTWARFAEVASIQSNLVDPRDFKSAPHIAPDNIESGTGRLLPYETIGASGVFSSKHRFNRGCLLYSKIRPALAKVVAVDFDGLCSADMYPIVPLIDRKYLQQFMLTEAFVRQSVSEDNRVAMPKINQESLAKIAVAVPPLAEQHRIVAKVDELMSLCDQLEASLRRGENARSRLLNALLHETLQPSHDNVVDFDAARKRLLERRQAIGCRIVERLSRTKGFGRTRAVKPFYWAEAHCGIALGGRWGRGNFGPYDQWIMSFESDAVGADWFSCIAHPTSDGSSWIEYKPGPQLTEMAKMAAQVLDKKAAEFERVLTLLAGLDTDKTEIVTTLFAAWNDLLIEGKPVSDSIVITEMREHWHPSKGRFTSAQLQPWLDWLRQNDLVPKGLGPCTRHQTELL